MGINNPDGDGLQVFSPITMPGRLQCDLTVPDTQHSFPFGLPRFARHSNGKGIGKPEGAPYGPINRFFVDRSAGSRAKGCFRFIPSFAGLRNGGLWIVRQLLSSLDKALSQTRITKVSAAEFMVSPGCALIPRQRWYDSYLHFGRIGTRRAIISVISVSWKTEKNRSCAYVSVVVELMFKTTLGIGISRDLRVESRFWEGSFR